MLQRTQRMKTVFVSFLALCKFLYILSHSVHITTLEGQQYHHHLMNFRLAHIQTPNLCTQLPAHIQKPKDAIYVRVTTSAPCGDGTGNDLSIHLTHTIILMLFFPFHLLDMISVYFLSFLVLCLYDYHTFSFAY